MSTHHQHTTHKIQNTTSLRHSTYNRILCSVCLCFSIFFSLFFSLFSSVSLCFSLASRPLYFSPVWLSVRLCFSLFSSLFLSVSLSPIALCSPHLCGCPGRWQRVAACRFQREREVLGYSHLEEEFTERPRGLVGEGTGDGGYVAHSVVFGEGHVYGQGWLVDDGL